MPNIAKIIQEEIRRIAKKEVKAATTGLQKDLTALRKTVIAQRRRIEALEKENNRLTRMAGRMEQEEQKAEVESHEEKPDKTRITGRAVRTLREKLGLTQAEFAKLAGVSALTVYKWEKNDGWLSFRGGTKAGLLSLRGIGKREARKRLEEGEGEF